MKRKIIISLFVFISIVSFNACTTYDEGPNLSLLPASTRIKGVWNQTKFYLNGTENTSIVFEFTLKSDGTGTRTWQYETINDTKDIDWKFNDDKTILMFKLQDETEWDEATILRLTKSDLWITLSFGLLGTAEIHYEKV